MAVGLSFAVSLPSQSASLTVPSPTAQKADASQSTVGKVTAIGNGGHSFSIASTNDPKQTMDFVIDQNTKVEGQVHVGTTVTVAYQTKDGGANLALSVTAKQA